MVSPELVKKRKKRKLAAILGIVSSIGLTVFIIVAFLGRRTGSFTVGIVSREKAEFSLYDNERLENPTTFLRIGDIPEMHEYTAPYFTKDDEIDNINNDFTYGAVKGSDGKLKFMYFIKFTFLLKNTGAVPIDYTFNLFVRENNKPQNVDYDLLDLSRVRIFENDDNQHKYETYAKKSSTAHYNEHGELTYDKPIAGEYGSETYCGFATQYASDDILVSFLRENFQPNQVRRYTIVTWLEGEDEKSKGESPKDCSIKLGVELSGYETVKEI